MKTEEIVKRLLDYFLHQDVVDKVESKDGLVKIYRVGTTLIRIDIKVFPLTEATPKEV